MVQKDIQKLPKSVVEVTINVPWADLEPKWNETLQRLAAEVELPGFRKGAAPLNMVEQNLGQKLQDEVLRTAMPQFLIEALQGSDVVPIDYPNYQMTSFVKGQGLQFKATVTNRPQVSVGNYKTIKVGRPTPKTVGDEDVNKIVDDLYNRWKARQGTRSSGQGTVAQGTPGSGGSISFQGGVQGASDDQATGTASPAGGQGGPDDNFTKAMGAVDLNDLKAKIRKDLEDNAKYNNELDYEEAILQEVEKITSVELPEVLISDELNRMLVSLQRRVADMGLLLEDYLKSQNKTLEQLKNEWKPQAEKNVRMELGLAEIARAENVTISDQELQAEIDKIQDARVKQQFEAQEPRLQLRHALRQTRTLDLLKKMVAGSQ